MQRLHIVVLALVALVVACSQQSSSTIPAAKEPRSSSHKVHRRHLHPRVAFPSNIPVLAYVGTTPYTTRFPWGDPGNSVAEKYLTYAESVPVGNSQIMNNDCPPGGFCKPLFYFDPHIIACTTTQDNLWYNAAQNQTNDNWFTHTGSPPSPSNREAATPSPAATWCPNTTDYISGPYVEYFPYAASTGNQNFWLSNVFAASGVRSNTVFFEDDTFFYPTPSIGLEYSSPTALLQAEGDEINAYAPNKIVCNCLGPGGGNYGPNGTDGHYVHVIELFNQYATKGNLLAGTFEKPIAVFSPYPGSGNDLNADNFPIVINTASRLLNNSSGKIDIFDLTDQAVGSDPTAERILHIALVWLIQDYFNDDPTRIISNEIPGSSPFGQVGIYPEDLIVPSGSLQQFASWNWSGTGDGSGCISKAGGGATPDPNSSGGVMDFVLACSDGGVPLTFAGGSLAAIYAREFTDCYYNNVDQGGCAAIINTSNRTVTTRAAWNLVLTYRHEITVSGGPINSACPTVSACNGTLSFKAKPYAPGTTQIPANAAILLTAK